MKGTAWLLAGLLALLLLAAGGVWLAYLAFLARPLDLPEDGAIVLVQRGDSVSAVVERLPVEASRAERLYWRLLTRLRPVTIEAGEYALQPGLTPTELLDMMAEGRVLQHRFTIVEGWSYRQLRSALLRDEVLEADPANLEESVVMERLGSPARHPEGWFLPETYAYVRGDRAIDLLARAHLAMREALQAEWAGRASGLPLETPYELLILASIVERETGIAAERASVAGVFVRRLLQGWRLETDPTVIYGLGEGFDGDLRRRDLQADSPYNTYLRHGLPPTPIAMPGRPALRASAHPEDGTAMFFVASGDGGHVFSDTLEEHQRAVQALIQRGRN